MLLFSSVLTIGSLNSRTIPKLPAASAMSSARFVLTVSSIEDKPFMVFIVVTDPWNGGVSLLRLYFRG
jgi:hypothetical protein